MAKRGLSNGPAPMLAAHTVGRPRDGHLAARIETMLTAIRPLLEADGVPVELVGAQDHSVRICLTGQAVQLCDCSAQPSD